MSKIHLQQIVNLSNSISNRFDSNDYFKSKADNIDSKSIGKENLNKYQVNSKINENSYYSNQKNNDEYSKNYLINSNNMNNMSKYNEKNRDNLKPIRSERTNSTNCRYG